MLGSVTLFGPLVVALWVFSAGDVIATPRAQVRGLSKRRWLLLTALVPLVGSVAWIVAGRPAVRTRGGYGRDGRATVIDDADIALFVTASSPTDTDATEDFRRRCRERAHEQRVRYAAQQREAGRGTNGVAGATD